MDDHVAKPIEPGRMLALLARWIGARPETAPAPSREALAAATGWPQRLPGLDLGHGLERAGGNRELYASLLRSFREKRAGVADEIRRAIERGDRETAERLAHSMRGSAGNLSANHLHDAAVELEGVIAEGRDGELESAQRRFAGALDELIRSLRQLEGTPGEPGTA
jgi:two-component system sensor histidine kinase/response regulator